MIVEAEVATDSDARPTLQIERDRTLNLRRRHAARGVDAPIGEVLRRGSAGDPELPGYLPDVADSAVPFDNFVDLIRAHLTGHATFRSLVPNCPSRQWAVRNGH